MTRQQAHDQLLAKIRDIVHDSPETWMQKRRQLEPVIAEFVQMIEAELMRIA